MLGSAPYLTLKLIFVLFLFLLLCACGGTKRKSGFTLGRRRFASCVLRAARGFLCVQLGRVIFALTRLNSRPPWTQRLMSRKGSLDSGDNLCTGRNCARYPLAREACLRHIVNSSKVIRALGMSVAQFNAVSRKLGGDEELRERVMEQAYLYRVASTLTLGKLPIVEDPASDKLLEAHKRRRLMCFARSLTQIEDLREEQTKILKKTLNVKKLPTNFRVCDPNILPFLSPKIQQICSNFPTLAEEVVRNYGLNSKEFNTMLDETRRNPLFRWRISRYVKAIKANAKKDGEQGG